VALAASTAALTVVIAPRRLPDPGPLASSGEASTELVTFGLRVIACSLSGYAAVVLVAVALAATRRIPAALGGRIHRWTGRGLPGLVRRAAGLSLAVAVTLPAATASAEPARPAPPVLAPAPVPADPAPAPPAPGPIERTVVAGDSFWRIAEAVVGARLGRPPSDAEVAPYWVDLIDANRDRLVHPGDPDLLLPGQVLRLPPPAGH